MTVSYPPTLIGDALTREGKTHKPYANSTMYETFLPGTCRWPALTWCKHPFQAGRWDAMPSCKWVAGWWRKPEVVSNFRTCPAEILWGSCETTEPVFSLPLTLPTNIRCARLCCCSSLLMAHCILLGYLVPGNLLIFLLNLYSFYSDPLFQMSYYKYLFSNKGLICKSGPIS